MGFNEFEKAMWVKEETIMRRDWITFPIVIWFRDESGHGASTVIPETSWFPTYSSSAILSTLSSWIPQAFREYGIPLASSEISFKAFWYGENVFIEDSASRPSNNRLLIVIEEGVYDEDIDLITALVKVRYRELTNKINNSREVSSVTSILFLAADPTNASRLRLGEEFREIDEQLTLAKQRDHFNLALPQLSLRPSVTS